MSVMIGQNWKQLQVLKAFIKLKRVRQTVQNNEGRRLRLVQGLDGLWCAGAVTVMNPDPGAGVR